MKWPSPYSLVHFPGLIVAILGGFGSMALGQNYQVQGSYNPGAVAPRSTRAPVAYQQVAPPPGAGLPSGYPSAYQPAYQQTAVYHPASAGSSSAYLMPVYQQAPPLPSAYAERQTYVPPPVPSQYPTYSPPKPSTPKASSSSSSTANEIAALKAKDREQDRRLAALEVRRHSPSTPATNSSLSTSHTVRRGESLWGIAERYGVSEEAIKAANHRDSDMILEGETLVIPGAGGVRYSAPIPSKKSTTGNSHIVQRGESLSTIAASYRISTRSLQTANGITNPNLIAEGQRLVIPGVSSPARSTPSAPIKKSTTPRYVTKPAPKRETVAYHDVPAPGEGLGSVVHASGPRGVTSYRVEAGDTIESVARTFTTTPSEIQRINKLSSQRLPAVGEEIIVPLPGSVAL